VALGSLIRNAVRLNETPQGSADVSALEEAAIASSGAIRYGGKARMGQLFNISVIESIKFKPEADLSRRTSFR
jgi:hypothetical protein